MRRAIITLIALPVLAACDNAAPPPSEPLPIGPAFQATTTVPELMEWILEPATEGIWDAAGTIITAEGERELAPTTDAGWAASRRQSSISRFRGF